MPQKQPSHPCMGYLDAMTTCFETFAAHSSLNKSKFIAVTMSALWQIWSNTPSIVISLVKALNASKPWVQPFQATPPRLFLKSLKGLRKLNLVLGSFYCGKWYLISIPLGRNVLTRGNIYQTATSCFPFKGIYLADSTHMWKYPYVCRTMTTNILVLVTPNMIISTHTFKSQAWWARY